MHKNRHNKEANLHKVIFSISLIKTRQNSISIYLGVSGRIWLLVETGYRVKFMNVTFKF